MRPSNPWDQYPSDDRTPPGEGKSLLDSGGGLPVDDLRAMFTASAVRPGGTAREPLRDPVLDELAEQACTNTNATGAAIALATGDEFVCVASAGSTAPDFGVQLDTEQGFSAICLLTREMQRCDDTESDPRVNAEACRQLGVRSVLVVPLILGEQLVGLFELFSPMAGAFSDRDIQTLYSISWRVLDHLAMPSEEDLGQPLALGAIHVSPAENSSVEHTPAFHVPTPMPYVYESSENEAASKRQSESKIDEDDEEPLSLHVLEPQGQPFEAGHQEDFYPEFNMVQTPEKKSWTRILTMAIVAMALVLGWVLGRGGPPPAPAPSVVQPEGAQEQKPPREETLPSSIPASDLSLPPAAEPRGAEVPPVADTAKPNAPRKADGKSASSQGLVVYKNGKVVFKGIQSKSRAADERAETTADAPATPPAQIPSETAGTYLVHKVEPQYPAKARDEGIHGPVVLQAVVDEEGQVQQLKVLEGNSQLAVAAIEAVRRWQFKPYAPNGQPTSFETHITVNFSLPSQN